MDVQRLLPLDMADDLRRFLADPHKLDSIVSHVEAVLFERAKRAQATANESRLAFGDELADPDLLKSEQCAVNAIGDYHKFVDVFDALVAYVLEAERIAETRNRLDRHVCPL